LWVLLKESVEPYPQPFERVEKMVGREQNVLNFSLFVVIRMVYRNDFDVARNGLSNDFQGGEKFKDEKNKRQILLSSEKKEVVCEWCGH